MELPDLPHLAELPERGVGADLTGRTAGLLVDMPVEATTTGWRFAGRPGRELSRARGLLSSDLDALEETAGGYRGPLKIQVCGPWTLAATIELARSQDPALADPGAVADLTASLAEGIGAHVGEVRKASVQQARFVVLKSPDIPSMLIETAYISNPAEERRLRNPEQQSRLADAICGGVRSYFVQNPPDGTRFKQERRSTLASAAGAEAAAKP